MGVTEFQLVALWLIAGALLFSAATLAVVALALAVEIRRQGEGPRRRPRCQGWHEALPPPEGLGGGAIERRTR